MDVEILLRKLVREYGFTLSKQELAEVLHVSITTVDRRRSQNPELLPPSKKIGVGARARVVFPTHGVADYLMQTR